MDELQLVTRPEAAKIIGMGVSFLEKLTPEELPIIRLGRAVRYDVADLRAWYESKKIRKTLAR